MKTILTVLVLLQTIFTVFAQESELFADHRFVSGLA